MEDQLKDIIDRVYSEGIDLAEQKADEILKNATDEADAILKSAKQKEAQILSDAREEAAQLKENVLAELRLAKQETVSIVKQDLADMFARYTTQQPLSSAFEDVDFVQELMLNIVSKWEVENRDLSLTWLLPEVKITELQDLLEQRSKEKLRSGVEIKFEDYASIGFRVDILDEGYSLEFTKESLETFFNAFLRERTLAMLTEKTAEKE